MNACARYWRRTAEGQEPETLLSEALLRTSAFEASGSDASDSYTKSGSWSGFSEPACQLPGTQTYS